MSQQPKVTVLGLGAMGHAFAANLLKKGFSVRGWRRRHNRGFGIGAQCFRSNVATCGACILSGKPF